MLIEGEYRKNDVQWLNDNYEHLRFTISRLNPEAAFHLMQAIEKEGYDVGLIAARVLEHLGSVAS
jgi:hypothetical protein